MRFHVKYTVLIEDQHSLRSYEPPNRELWNLVKKTVKGQKMRIYEGTLKRKDFDKFVRHCGLIALYAMKDRPGTTKRPVDQVAFANICTNQVVAVVDICNTMRGPTNHRSDPIERAKKLADTVMKIYGGKR
jgi:hypothetical protein